MNANALPRLSAPQPVRPAVGSGARKAQGQALRAPWALSLVALVIAGCGAEPDGTMGAGDHANAGVSTRGDAPDQAYSRAQTTSLTAHADPAGLPREAADALQAADGVAAHHGSERKEGLLRGEATELAVQALRVLAPAQAQPHYPRLLALLPAQARVGEVNEALRHARLRIDEMRPGNHSLVLVAAGSGMAAGELDQAAQRLQATGVFDRVMRLAPPPRPNIAPQNMASVAALNAVWAAEAAQCSDE